jgi:hypothetical protein
MSTRFFLALVACLLLAKLAYSAGEGPWECLWGTGCQSAVSEIRGDPPSLDFYDLGIDTSPNMSQTIIGDCPFGPKGSEDCDIDIRLLQDGTMVTLIHLDTTNAGYSRVMIGDPYGQHGTAGTDYLQIDEDGVVSFSGSNAKFVIGTSSGPTLGTTNGSMAFDTTDWQLLVYGNGRDIVIPTRQYQCVPVADAVAATDDYVWLFDDEVLVTSAWCRTAVGGIVAEPTIELSSSIGGANMTGTITCEQPSDTASKTGLSGSTTLTPGGAGQTAGLVVEVIGAPNPTPMDLVVCFEYRTSRE